MLLAGGSLIAMVFMLVLAVLSLWAVFWIIRLGVRYGVDDALRMSRARKDERADRTRV